jgi:hypothetical protein
VATDRTVLVRLKAEVGDFVAGMGTAAAAVKGVTREIDTSNNRTTWLAQSILALGPALIPLGAAGVPIFAGLAAEVGVAAGAVGVLALVFNGLGDGLKALNQYQLDPTAANLEKLNQQMALIGPNGEEFVRFLDSLEPAFRAVQNEARGAALPGFEDGLRNAITLLPVARQLILDFSSGLGELARQAGQGLSSGKLDDFFGFLQTDAKSLLMDLGQTIGNILVGIGNLFVGFRPLIEDFSKGMLHASQSFAAATDNIGSKRGFQEFIDYVEKSGPRALTLLESLGGLLLSVLEAAAPIGDKMLQILPPILDVVSALASTPLGTLFIGIAAGMSLYGRAVALASITTSGLGKVFDQLGLSAKGSLLDLRLMPAAIAQVQGAEERLMAAEAEANAARRTYLTTLQTNNRLQAEGYTIGTVGAARQADGLTRLELALNEVTAAEERLAAAQKEQSGIMSGARGGALKTAGIVGGLALATSGLADSTGLSNTAMFAALGSIVPGWGTAIGAAAGYALDFKAANDKGTDSVNVLNNALEASKGDFEAQQEAIDAAREAAAAMADDTHTDSFGEFFKNAFDPDVAAAFTRDALGLQTAQEQVTSAADQAQEALDREKNLFPTFLSPLNALTSGVAEAAAAEDAHQAAIEGVIQAMRDQRAEAARSLNAHLAYRASILDAQDALKKNGKTIDENTRAGQDNLTKLYAMATGWNAQSNAAKNATGSLKAARHEFLQMADDMGMPIDKAKRLANQLFEIPAKRRTEFEEPGVDDAIHKAKTLSDILASLHDKDINIALHYATFGNRPGTPGRPLDIGGSGADGMTVPKTGLAYADRHLILAADGEEIVSNRYGQADRWRPWLKAISANKMADGGTAGGTKNKTPGSQGFTVFLPQAMAALVQGVDSVTKALRVLNAALDKAQKKVDKDTKARDDIASMMSSLSSTVQSQLRTDIFAQPTSGFATQVSATEQLDRDTQQAEEETHLIESLSGKGLTGAALAEVIGGGITRLRAYDNMSSTDLQAYAAAFARREKALQVAGTTAGTAAYGADFNAATKVLNDSLKELREIRQAIKVMDKENQKATDKAADKVKDGVNGAAGKGKRNRVYA